MKRKDKDQLNTKSVAELAQLVSEARNELFSLHIEKAQQKLKNTRALFMKRKYIALLLTFIKQKEVKHEKNS